MRYGWRAGNRLAGAGHRVAGGEVVLGHVRQQGGDVAGALAHYSAAAGLLPGDAAMTGLVRACQALLAGR